MFKTKTDKRISASYQGTTTDRNDPAIAALKAEIKGKNLRVCLRGRKPKTKQVVRNFWTGKQGLRGYDFGGNVVGGLDNAQEFDVYVYTRSF